MNLLECAFLEFQARWLMVDAHLAELRGDRLEAADCECRADECRQQIALLKLMAGKLK